MDKEAAAFSILSEHSVASTGSIKEKDAKPSVAAQQLSEHEFMFEVERRVRERLDKEQKENDTKRDSKIEKNVHDSKGKSKSEADEIDVEKEKEVQLALERQLLTQARLSVKSSVSNFISTPAPSSEEALVLKAAEIARTSDAIASALRKGQQLAGQLRGVLDFWLGGVLVLSDVQSGTLSPFIRATP